MVEPKTAIACRDEVELAVVIGILQREEHVTDFLEDMRAPLRIYVCPKYDKYGDGDDIDPHDDLMYNTADYVDDYDDDDDFEWNYVEASDMFRNQIISARLKGE